jgi:mannose-1-phosphate guanylyltransferase
MMGNLTVTEPKDNPGKQNIAAPGIPEQKTPAMPVPANAYALILAGGSGTRFWPLSRDSRPKQLLDLFGDGTLLEHAIRRLEGLVPLENILILTNEKQAAAVRECAPMLPPENIFAEPAKRDTAPAVALGIGLVAARDPDAVMMVLPADQLIRDTAAYREVMRDAMAVAEKSDGLVTIGIQPTWPCPSFGYIERGIAADLPGIGHVPHEVIRFREKPSPELAEQFLRQGGFCWNAGMFVWSLPVVTAQLAKHAPELATFIDELKQSPDLLETVAEKFPLLPARSIDYALMEKADRVLNIEATFDWDDVGSWISVAKYLQTHGDGNRANTAITEIDSKDNIVFNARPGTRVALLGVNDLIIVQTEDALLVANRHEADAIKNLSPLLPGELL